MRSAPRRIAVIVAAFFLVTAPFVSLASNSSSIQIEGGSRWLGATALGAFVRKYMGGTHAVCVEASDQTALRLRERDSSLFPINAAPDSDRPGLKILLRGTSQLQGFPAAREAFKRAAAQWQELIQTPVIVVVDVDFGPAFFGDPFDDGIVSAADAQVLSGNSLYRAVRSALISSGDSAERTSLYNSLPPSSVPTDAGDSAGISASSATLRCLELIDQTADPEGERGSFGPPPAIAYNSSFGFDFDSSNGIDPDKLDLESMAVHDLGHVLGLVSCVGQQELHPDASAGSSLWDLFRIRPESVEGDFTSALRVLSSGGEQRFFAGDAALSLSTGRPDGEGGDDREAAHWKDDDLTGTNLGIMDPTISPGEHNIISENDVVALETIGYRVRSIFLVPLVSGRPQTGGMPAPPAGLGFISHTQYSITVPAGATGLTIDLSGNQDVDLFARFGQRVFNQGFHPESDYLSASDSGVESINVNASSSPPLRPGTYYIAVATFGPGDAEYTVTATITGGAASRPPAIFDIRPHLDGDMLTLACAAVDLDADLASTDVSLLDEAEQAVGSFKFAIDAEDSRYVAPVLSITGMKLLPAAVTANVVLIDRAGNRSLAVTADFSKADPGGLTLRSASFDGSRLTLKASGSAESLEVEINGEIVAPPLKIKSKKSGAKLIIAGDAGQLGLRAGANRIRVRNSRGWSGIVIIGT